MFLFNLLCRSFKLYDVSVSRIIHDLPDSPWHPRKAGRRRSTRRDSRGPPRPPAAASLAGLTVHREASHRTLRASSQQLRMTALLSVVVLSYCRFQIWSELKWKGAIVVGGWHLTKLQCGGQLMQHGEVSNKKVLINALWLLAEPARYLHPSAVAFTSLSKHPAVPFTLCQLSHQSPITNFVFFLKNKRTVQFVFKLAWGRVEQGNVY